MEKTFIGPYISNDMLVCDTVDQFLEPFQNSTDFDLSSDMHLDFEIYHKTLNRKVSPILTLARPEDAKVIVKIYHELYFGTYPYREMEDEQEVRRMIESPSFYFILFKDQLGNIAGCVTFVLDFGNKRGYIRGFMLRKEFQGKIDIVKAMMGSMIGMCSTLKGKILVWYVENRTAHSKSQYPMWACGIRPIGFFPNKDVFFNRIESDLMQIIYDSTALKDLRVNKTPQIIPEALNCFKYSTSKYSLGNIQSENPKLKLDKNEIIKSQSRLKRKITTDKYGYHYFTLSLLGTDSYFKFLYTPQVQNFEKAKYQVENTEQLSVFVQDFKMLAQAFSIRYFEAFVQAYDLEHQKIFLNSGMLPRGYVPSWNFNQNKRKFEDSIIFNSFRGDINKNIQLIEEGKELLRYLNFKI